MEWLFPLGSLVVGWLLNEMAKKFQMSRERQAHIGRALSNLLELRHQILAVENAIELSSKQLSLPDDSKSLLRILMEQILPQEDEFVAQYEEAIEQLSESDPVTAFDLRTRGQTSRFIKTIRTLGTAQGASTTEIAMVEKLLKEALLPALEKGVMELAKLHGKQTKKRVEKILRVRIILIGNTLVQGHG